jgi:hypothetical protein
MKNMIRSLSIAALLLIAFAGVSSAQISPPSDSGMVAIVQNLTLHDLGTVALNLADSKVVTVTAPPLATVTTPISARVVSAVVMGRLVPDGGFITIKLGKWSILNVILSNNVIVVTDQTVGINGGKK